MTNFIKKYWIGLLIIGILVTVVVAFKLYNYISFGNNEEKIKGYEKEIQELKIENASSKGREQIHQMEKDSLTTIIDYQLAHPQMIINKYEQIRIDNRSNDIDASVGLLSRNLSKKRN